MHEFGVTESLLKIVEESANNAGVEKVSRIVVVVGELTGFVPDCMRFYFETMSKDTVAEGASLDFEELPVRLKCRQCGHEFVPENREWACPQCQSSEADITGGRELYVKELEVT